MDGFQIIAIIISIIAVSIAGFSAYFSHRSAKSAVGSLQYIKTPLLIIEYKGGVYFYIKNVGNGIAKNIKWKSPNGLEYRTESENFDFLLPNAQSLSESGMNPDGIEIKLVVHKENMEENKKYILNVSYEDIEDKNYFSEFYIFKKGNDFKHKIKELQTR
jgi:hypothetical protein